MMTSFEAFKTYLALKLHFSPGSSFDYIKTPTTKAKPASLERRKDRFLFEKMARTLSKQELVHFFVANIVAKNRPSWVGDLLDSDAETCYVEWKKKIEGLTYVFEQDVNTMVELMEAKGKTFNDLFLKPRNAIHPVLVLYFQKYISLETIIILDMVLGCFTQFELELGEDLLWQEVSHLARKYKPFLAVDLNRCISVLRRKLLNVPEREGFIRADSRPVQHCVSR